MENFNLYGVDADTATDTELRDAVKHMQNTCRNTYLYLVGEWNNGHRAISTRTGKFVQNDEVVHYLTKIE